MFPPPRNRIKKQKGAVNGRAYLFGAAAVLVVVAVFLTVRWLFFSRNAALRAQELRFEATSAYDITESSILFVQGNELCSIDYANNEKWRVALLNADMKVSASESLAAAYDSALVQIFSSAGEPLASKEFYGTVTQVRCGKTLTAVLNADFENQNRVILFDSAGVELTRYQFDGKYILDFGFYEDDSFYIYMLDGGSVVPVSRLMTYNKELANTGNIAVESQILQHLVFLPQRLYAVGTNQVIEMNYVGVRAGEKLIYGWEYADNVVSRGGSATFLMIPGGESSGQKVISTARILQVGAGDVFAQMPSATIAVSLSTNRLYAFTPNSVRVLNHQGETVSEHQLPFEAQSFVTLPTKKHALCISGKSVFIVKLP